MATKPESVLSVWIWLLLPLFFLIYIFVVIYFFPHQVDFVVAEENGPVELGTFLVLLPAIMFGVMALKKSRILPDKRLAIWLLLVTLGCVYIAGEEVSWGQQFFHWGTPEYMQEINDQHETNIHNISSWFDQKPRILLAIWILVGGVLLISWRLIRNYDYPVRDWRYWFWPGLDCLPSAIIAMFIRAPERYHSFTGKWPLPVPVRVSEIQELYIACFLAIYLMSWYVRMGKLEKENL